MSRRNGVTLLLGLLAVLAVAIGFAQGADPAAHGPIFTPKEIAWGPGPAVLNAGAQMAVLEGNPSQSGLYTLRLKLPDGFKIMPHSHPTIEHVTVISGVMNAAMGDTFDKTKGSAMPVGSYAVLPAQMNHYAWFQGASTIQVHGEGPFVLNYANPKDDPSGGAKKP
jgi:hypothetical protein